MTLFRNIAVSKLLFECYQLATALLECYASYYPAVASAGPDLASALDVAASCYCSAQGTDYYSAHSSCYCSAQGIGCWRFYSSYRYQHIISFVFGKF